MSPTITLKGSLKFSFKKVLGGGEMSKSTYTGPGEILLAPSSMGDITIIKLGGQEQWSVGKDAFLACTQGIITEYKTQGIGKGMLSGEGFFVYKVSGVGVLWITSFGAIIRKDVSHCDFAVFLLTLDSSLIKVTADVQTAPKRREIHHRQRTPSRLELQVRPRARCVGGHSVKHDGR